jgi:hypothetical protein
MPTVNDSVIRVMRMPSVLNRAHVPPGHGSLIGSATAVPPHVGPTHVGRRHPGGLVVVIEHEVPGEQRLTHFALKQCRQLGVGTALLEPLVETVLRPADVPWSLVKGVDGGPSGTGWYQSAAMR